MSKHHTKAVRNPITKAYTQSLTNKNGNREYFALNVILILFPFPFSYSFLIWRNFSCLLHRIVYQIIWLLSNYMIVLCNRCILTLSHRNYYIYFKFMAVVRYKCEIMKFGRIHLFGSWLSIWFHFCLVVFCQNYNHYKNRHGFSCITGK